MLASSFHFGIRPRAAYHNSVRRPHADECGLKVADSGAGSHRPAAAAEAGTSRAAHSRYKRHGTTSLFAALDAQGGGKVISQTHRRHRSIEFRKFPDRIDASVPPDQEVHIVMDNCGTHIAPLIRAWFAKRPRVHVYFTPTYGSWLNQVERWFPRTHDETDSTWRPSQRERVGARHS